MKKYIYNLEAINPSNRNTPHTKDQYDLRTSQMYQVCRTDSNGRTERFEYGVCKMNKKTINLYCHQQKCRAMLVLKLIPNGPLTVGKVPTKSGGEKWGYTDDIGLEQIQNILNYGEIDHSCGKGCSDKGCKSEHVCRDLPSKLSRLFVRLIYAAGIAGDFRNFLLRRE